MLNTAQTSQQPNIVATVRIQTSNTTPKTPAPGRIAVAPDSQAVFVVDTANNAVVRFNRQGNTLTQNQAWLAPANAPFELRDIAISNRGELFVVNAANDEVIVFDANNIQTEKAHVSLRDQQFPVINPTNLALNNIQTKLYVTESSANAVGMISLAAAPLQGNVTIGQVGRNIPLNTGATSDRSVTNPIGIDTTSDDRSVYVANGGNFNLSLLDGNLDVPKRNFATSTSLGTSVPLGKIVIVSISTTTATTRTQSIYEEYEASGASAPNLPDLAETLR